MAKPYFTDKKKTKSKITLIRKKNVSQEGQEEIVSEKMISEDQAVAEIFNKFFKFFQTWKYLLIMVMIMISLLLMA